MVKAVVETALDTVVKARIDTVVDAMELQHISLKEIEPARSNHTSAPAARNSLAQRVTLCPAHLRDRASKRWVGKKTDSFLAARSAGAQPAQRAERP
jgi:hypothetical protein